MDDIGIYRSFDRLLKLIELGSEHDWSLHQVIEGSKLYGNDFHLFSKATSDPYVRIRLADDETRTSKLLPVEVYNYV